VISFTKEICGRKVIFLLATEKTADYFIGRLLREETGFGSA
jgi:hypothetical protein